MLLIGRERGKGQIRKIPGPSPSKSGKSRKNRESPTKKDKKGRTSIQFGQRLRGGKTYRVNLGGGNVLQSVLSKTTFGGLRNWGWSGRCLFLLREMTESRQKRGGGNVLWVGGSKNVFGEGFFAEFTVCFPPPEFSTPLGRSLNNENNSDLSGWHRGIASLVFPHRGSAGKPPRLKHPRLAALENRGGTPRGRATTLPSKKGS